MNEKTWYKVDYTKNRYTSAWSLKEKVVLVLWRANYLLYRYSPKKIGRYWRVLLLRLFGAEVHWSFLHPSSRIFAPWQLKLGKEHA